MLLVTVASLNSLHDGLLLDDRDIVERNPHFGSPQQWLKVFMPSQRPARLATYRPVRELTFAADQAIWGESVVGRHLSSLVVYIGAILMLWVVARRMELLKTTTFVVTCWFALHAAHSETLCWLKNRGEMLATLFGLGCLASCLARGPTATLVASFCLLAAVGSMESAVVFAGVALVGAVSAEHGRRRERLRTAVILAVAATVCVVAHKGVLSQMVGRPNTPTLALPPSPSVVLELAGRYCHMLVTPQNLCLDAVAGVGPTASQMVAIAVVAAACAVGLRRGGRACASALVLLPLGLISVIVVRDRPLAEHRAFAASAGLAVCIGFLMQGSNPGGRNRVKLMMLLLGSCALAALFVQRNSVWQGDARVWRDNIVKSPQSAKARLNFAYTCARRGLLRRAEKNLISAIRVYRRDSGYLNLVPPEATLRDALERVRGL